MSTLTLGTKESGARFALPIELTTQSVAILAKRGVGKSYTSAVMVEELLSAGQVPVIIDPTGAHWGLKSSADGNSAGFKVVIFGGDHADIPLEETAGEATAQAIVEQRFPAVIDLSCFRKGQFRRFITDFLETLYRLNRLPLMLIIDEADDVAPQKPFGDEARMVGACEDVVKRGRRRGLGCVLITQRPADLAKQVLTQCEMLVAMRLVHPLDIKAVMEWVNVHADREKAAEMIGSLPSLPIGTAWFWSPGWGDIFERVKIRKRTTFDSGATPKPGEKKIEPRELAAIDIDRLGQQIAAAVQRAKENDPAALKREIARLKADVPRPQEPKEVRILTDNERATLDRLVRELKEISETQAKTHGVIESVGNQVEILRSALYTRVQASAPPMHTASKMVRAPMTMPGRSYFESGGKKKSSEDRTVGPFTEQTGSLPRGEQIVLTACAQYESDGCTREQLTVLTGYKRSSRDSFISRLKDRGMVEIRGESIVATGRGVRELGSNFTRLPVGDELAKYWLQRLPEGERMVLEIVLKAYPTPVHVDQISEKTGYKRSSRDSFIYRLAAKKLVARSDGIIIPSVNLFS